jgi:DNA polymerase-3 subunit gamma/tau
VSGIWSALVDSVGRASPFTRTYLLEAHPVSFNKNVLVIGFDPEFEDHLALVDNARNHALLQTKLTELGHANAQVKFVKAEGLANTRPPAQASVKPVEVSAPAPKAPAPVPVVKSSAPPIKEKMAPIPFNKDDFKNDPLIQRALEIFRGQIIEVRA